MNIRLKFWHKLLITFVAFVIAIAGFMLRLPAMFSGRDREMHTLFYFLAAAFLNILFAKRNILVHALIFVVLYCFGVAIEYAQEYSNTLLHRKIHGNADPEDMHANLQGLIYFSAVWMIYVLLYQLWKFAKGNSAHNVAGKS